MELTDLVYIDATGYHFSDFPTFLSWLQDKYRGIYGADIYLEADSQDGQFLAILAKAFYDTAALGGSVYNSFSPSTAQGTGLARVVKINGLKKQVPSFSTVTLTIVGTAGTVITFGVATDSLQQKWLLPSVVTIPGGGTIDVTATAENVGFVNAEANTITTIFTPTRGWQTVNNASGATPGAPVEADSQLRTRQSVSTADPSLTVFDGTVGAIANVTGVTKVRGYENDTDSTDGNGIPEHSISCVVAGGGDVAIAQAIQVHKTPGTNTFGDTTETVYDAHGMPLDISFQRAETASIQVQVTITPDVGWSTDFELLIQNAIADVINTGRSAAKFLAATGGIGQKIILSKLFAPAYLNGTAPGQTYSVVSIELQKNGTGGFSAADVDLDWDENPVCDPSTDVTVIV